MSGETRKRLEDVIVVGFLLPVWVLASYFGMVWSAIKGRKEVR